MAKQKHIWCDDRCGVCGCRREWRQYVGYARFVWEDGRVVEPNGQGEPACEGLSKEIIETATTALMGAESKSPREKATAVIHAYQDVFAALPRDGKA